MRKLMTITLFAILFGVIISCESESIAEQDELYENTIPNIEESGTDKPKVKRPGNGS